MKRLWIVGCSISHGVGVTESQHYGHLLARSLNCPYWMMTASGTSIEWAASKILRADIKKGDIVTWGITSPGRFLYYSNNGEPCHVLNAYYDREPNFEKLISIDRLTDNNLAYKAVDYINQVSNFLTKIEVEYSFGYMLMGTDEQKDIIRKNIIDPRIFVAYNDNRDNPRFIDKGTDNLHPGPKQHQLYSKMFMDNLLENRS